MSQVPQQRAENHLVNNIPRPPAPQGMACHGSGGGRISPWQCRAPPWFIFPTRPDLIVQL